jgi:hypothetical protein
VPDPEPAPPTVTDGAGTHPATVYEETGYGLVGIGGESRSGDANGEYIRVEAGGGANTPVIPGPISGGVGQVITGLQPASQTVPFVGFAESQILGSRPNLSAGHDDSLKTPFRPTTPCERQQPPNLEASTGPAPPQTPAGSGSLTSSSLPPPLQNLGHTALDYTKNYFQAQKLSAKGKNSQAQALLKQAGSAWLRYQSDSQPWLKSEVKKINSLGGSALQGTPLGGSQ